MNKKNSLAAFLLFSLCLGGKCFRANEKDLLKQAELFKIDKESAKKDLEYLASAPHPFGSMRQSSVKDYIVKRVRDLGVEVVEQNFTADTPISKSANTQKISGTNIFAKISPIQKTDCLVLLGSHYDTKIVEGLDYRGANDSGSSSILLLQLISFFKKHMADATSSRCAIGFVWFDGEEAVLKEWDDGEMSHPAKIQDNTYGSRFFANNLQKCHKKWCLPASMDKEQRAINAFILWDMVGSKNLRISLDTFSTPTLKEKLVSFFELADKKEVVSSYAQAIRDDHIPFLEKGIPALNIIDFQNIQHWHKAGDDIENISLASIELAGQAGLFVILSAQSQ